MNFTRISIFVVVAAAVVYFGLEHFFPHHKSELAVESGPTAEAAPAGTTEQTAATPASQDKPLSEADARKIAEDVGRKVGAEVAQRALEKQTAQPAAQEEAAGSAPAAPSAQKPAAAASTAAPPAEQSPAAGESSAAPAAAEVASAAPSAPPAARSHSKAASKPRPESKPQAEPTPRAEPAPQAEPVGKSAARPTPKQAKPSPPPLAIVTPWWPPADQQVAGKLNLMFAGEAASNRAIALLFSSTFSDAAAAGSHIKVTDAAGKPVHGQWALAPNPRLLIFRVVAGGRYNVAVAADLADAQGKTLAGALRGPVDVH